MSESLQPGDASSAPPLQCRLKIVLIGNSKVGKTSVLSRYVDNVYDAYIISTIGIDFKSKTLEINGKSIQLFVWDTAGQERYQSIAPAYCRRADGIVLLYDVTDLRSFECTASWVDRIRENSPDNVKIMLMGNKIDLQRERLVTTEMGMEAARRIDAQFFEVSAVNGSNINKAFKVFAKVILDERGFFNKQEDCLITLRRDSDSSNKTSRISTCCNQSTANEG